MYFNKFDLETQDRFYRGNLINCLSGTKPAVLIGTANAEGMSNLALFSNIFHLGANPALLAFVQRPVGTNGDTFRNIEATQEYTFNFVHEAIVTAAHGTSAKVPAELSEFAEYGFTENYLADFRAPFVEECPIQIGLRLVDVMPVPLNDTKIVIGSVEHIMLPDELIQEDGNLKIDAFSMMSILGLENYYKPQFVQHQGYAKWGQKS
jgi:flavin reductase (DIM6/NTAB) family NADH-FMN oxidoreductase RutF